MKKRIASALIVLALGAVPIAANAHGDEADATVPASQVPEIAQGDIYLDAETGAAYQETNGDAGLQTQPHTHGEGDDAVTIPADTRLTP